MASPQNPFNSIHKFELLDGDNDLFGDGSPGNTNATARIEPGVSAMPRRGRLRCARSDKGACAVWRC
jgi:hypothetical protein